MQINGTRINFLSNLLFIKYRHSNFVRIQNVLYIRSKISRNVVTGLRKFIFKFMYIERKETDHNIGLRHPGAFLGITYVCLLLSQNSPSRQKPSSGFQNGKLLIANF